MGNFCNSHPCDTVMYSTGVMNLRAGVVEIITSNRKIPHGPDHQHKPASSRCMQVVIAYRRKLQALLADGL